MKKTYVTTCNHMSVEHALQSYGARNVGNVITRKSRAEQNYCHFNRPLQCYDCVAVFIGKIRRVRFCRAHLAVSINFATDWKYHTLISSMYEVTIVSNRFFSRHRVQKIDSSTFSDLLAWAYFSSICYLQMYSLRAFDNC